MLTHIAIKNFTTVEQLALEFATGLSTITGETGAGKSVMLDALALTLGSRGNTNVLRDESQAAEVTASFSLNTQSAAFTWLRDKELIEADSDEVICRRILKSDGRSRSFINGSPVNLSDLKAIGEQLVDLHGQHEHQSLLNKATHQQMLDAFGKHQNLQFEVAQIAQQWSAVQREINEFRTANKNPEARQQLLAYQVQELDKLALSEGETKKLEDEQKMLANAEDLLRQLQIATDLCDSDSGDNNSGALTAARQSIIQLNESVRSLPELQGAIDLLDSASIQIEEALSEMQASAERVQIDPQRLRDVETRLDAIYAIARKHNIKPEQLAAQHQTLTRELKALENSDEVIAELLTKQTELTTQFDKKAQQLTKKRSAAAKKLITAVSKKLTDLQMKHCKFEVSLSERKADAPSSSGHESVEFLIATVPGKPTQPLAKIASGGELSRISLAIQVVTAQTSDTPTLVFDEVDVGIGGGVAEVVGNLLRELGKTCQVFCVTHLAQVAAKGSQHLLVSKEISKANATTRIDCLDNESRKIELARMLGGLDVTASTLAHASEILESA